MLRQFPFGTVFQARRSSWQYSELQHWWPSLHPRGGVLTDLIGERSVPLTSHHTWMIEGRAGWMLDFDGAVGAELNTGSFTPPVRATFAFFASIDANGDSLFGTGNSFEIRTAQNDILGDILNAGAAVRSVNPVVDSVLRHYVFRYDQDADTVDLFINGVLDAAATGMTGTPDVNDFYIGWRAGDATTDIFDGRLGDIRLYDGWLTAQQIFALYSNPFDLYEITSRVSPVFFSLPTGGGAPIIITPDAAISSASAVDPNTILGSLSVTPDIAISAAAAVGANVVLGSIAITPSIASSVAAAIDANVVLGSLTLTPGASNSAAAAIDPVTQLGSLSITPGVATSTASAIDPAIQITGGGVTVTPGTADSIALAIDATLIFSSMTFTPGFAASVAIAIDPIVIVASGVPTNIIADVTLDRTIPTVTLDRTIPTVTLDRTIPTVTLDRK